MTIRLFLSFFVYFPHNPFLEQLSRSTSTITITVKSKAVGKDLKIPYGNFAARRFAYDDHDDGGFANHIFNELCSFGPGTINIFRRMVGLPEAA